MSQKQDTPSTGRIRLLWFGGLFVLAGSLGALLALSGCGNAPIPRSTLIGAVSQADDKPLPGGTMHMKFDNGEEINFPIKGNGSFYFPNGPVGKAQIKITNKNLQGKQKASPDRQRGGTDLTPKKPPKGKEIDANMQEIMNLKKKIDEEAQSYYAPINPRYEAYDSSGLTWEVGPGEQRKTFKLEK